VEIRVEGAIELPRLKASIREAARRHAIAREEPSAFPMRSRVSSKHATRPSWRTSGISRPGPERAQDMTPRPPVDRRDAPRSSRKRVRLPEESSANPVRAVAAVALNVFGELARASHSPRINEYSRCATLALVPVRGQGLIGGLKAPWARPTLGAWLPGTMSQESLSLYRTPASASCTVARVGMCTTGGSCGSARCARQICGRSETRRPQVQSSVPGSSTSWPKRP
jgi:hypothetical protein